MPPPSPLGGEFPHLSPSPNLSPPGRGAKEISIKLCPKPEFCYSVPGLFFYSMRLVQVAKALGMTGQELRKELLQVNFGVKPTDREIPDTLAKGILRFVAQKRGLDLNVDALGLELTQEEGEAADGEAAAEKPAAQDRRKSPRLRSPKRCRRTSRGSTCSGSCP